MRHELRKRIWLLAALFLFSIPAFAQTKAQPLRITLTQHSVTLTWTDSLSGPTFTVLKAPCNGTITNGVCSSVGSFTTLATTAANVTSYTDTAVTAGQMVVYEVTATCAAPACGNNPATGALYSGTSLPSNLVAVTIPTPAPEAPPAPTNLHADTVQ